MEVPWKFIMAFSPLSLAVNLQVLLTTGRVNPLFTLASILLLVLLTKDTIAEPDNVPAFLKTEEENRLAQLMITSDYNRYIRMGMGTINIVSTMLYISYLSVKPTKQQKRFLSSEAAQWTLTAWGCLVGAIMFSTGYYGQWGKGVGSTPSWNPDGMGWREMPQELAKPYLEQFNKTNMETFILSIVGTLSIKVGIPMLMKFR